MSYLCVITGIISLIDASYSIETIFQKVNATLAQIEITEPTIANQTSLNSLVTSVVDISKIQSYEFTNNSVINVNDSSICLNGTSTPQTVIIDGFEYEYFGLRETAGIVAVVFLVFAIFGYAGFVLWRKYLQKKYGNGQTLITDEVYDTSDLRNFEI